MGVVTIELMHLYYIVSWATITTALLFIARRDMKIGLKKWFLLKIGKEPLVIRYYGPNLTVRDHVVATKGVGDRIDLYDKKFFGLKKSEDGSTFFMDEKLTRRRDDGLNELCYSYKSVTPLNPDATKDEVKEYNSGVRLRAAEAAREASGESADGNEPIAPDENVLFTDPMRLNRFIERVKNAAKAAALEHGAEDAIKYAKYSFFAACGAVIIGVLVWYTMDSQLIPQLQGIASSVSDIGKGVLEA